MVGQGSPSEADVLTTTTAGATLLTTGTEGTECVGQRANEDG